MTNASNKAPNEQATPLEDVKRASQQMTRFFQAKGIEVTHSLALEALSKSIGFENWRTLRARLALPLPEPITGPQFCVDAIYTDNDQLYGDHVGGASPLDAAIYVMLERLTDSGWITEVKVTGVTDRYTGKLVLCPSYLDELDLKDVDAAVAKLCALARKNLGEPPKRGIDAAEAWDRSELAIQFWESICTKRKEGQENHHNSHLCERLESLISDITFDVADYGDEPVLYTTFHGEELEVDVVALMKELIALAEPGLNVQEDSGREAKSSGVFQLLQMKNIVQLHEDRLKVVFNGEHIK